MNGVGVFVMALWLATAGAGSAAQVKVVATGPGEAARLGARPPVAQVLGITLGMPEDVVHRLLRRVGHPAGIDGGVEKDADAGSEGLERELWMVDKDRRYASVLVVFDEERQLHALQAYLKPGAKGLRYTEIGDLGQARRLGYTIWQWDVAPGPDRPGRRVIARGVDSTWVGSVAIVAVTP